MEERGRKEALMAPSGKWPVPSAEGPSPPPSQRQVDERGACRGPEVARSVSDRLHRAPRLRQQARQSRAVAIQGPRLHPSSSAR
jgi:hypothetical protein